MSQTPTTQQESIPSTSWHGKLELEFARTDDTTQLIHNQGVAPLKVQRSFYPEGKEVCHSVILHTAGGIVGGDRLSTTTRLQPQANALITTAAAGKVYRSNGLEARQAIQIQVGEGACLEWLPQETILFAGADYRQDLHVELAPTGSWLGWEMTRFGRSARGEQFLQGNWRSHTEVWREGVPLWIDRQWLTGNEITLHSPHGLAGYPVVGSFAFVGNTIDAETIAKIRLLWETGNYEGEAGVTRLMAGIICRYRGSSTQEVRHWLKQVWHLLRLSYLERPACSPRVWC